jgi:hypothetical protein
VELCEIQSRVTNLVTSTLKMASLIRYPRSKYYIAAFRDSFGRQYRKTTGELTRSRAQPIAELYERMARGQGKPDLVKAIVSDFYNQHYGTALPHTTTRDFLDGWLHGRKAEIAGSSFHKYQRVVSAFLESLGEPRRSVI